MSDQPQGPGWWLASDGKYYPPESAQVPHEEAQPPAGTPQWGSPGTPPTPGPGAAPGGYSAAPGAGGPPPSQFAGPGAPPPQQFGGPPPQQYGAPGAPPPGMPGAPSPVVKKSGMPGWAIALIVLFVLMVLGVGGCLVIVNQAADDLGEAIEDAAQEASEGVIPGEVREEYLAEATCAVTSVDSFDDYRITLIVENPTLAPVDYSAVVAVMDPATGAELGRETLFALDAPPGEPYDFEHVTFIEESLPLEAVTCEVVQVSR